MSSLVNTRRVAYVFISALAIFVVLGPTAGKLVADDETSGVFLDPYFDEPLPDIPLDEFLDPYFNEPLPNIPLSEFLDPYFDEPLPDFPLDETLDQYFDDPSPEITLDELIEIIVELIEDTLFE